ncbi:MAG TPA: AAA family ATPase [Mucilaginibacter sp.]|jgi:predicted ATPase|nr:AAA family ATPase [Mucilaginibacter sp.]
MRIDTVYIKQFKNLKDFQIELNDQEMKTILLGQNATGKSNFMEALVLIFKYLDLEKDIPQTLELEYRIDYICRNQNVRAEYLNKKTSFHFWEKTKNEQTLVIENKATDAITKTEFYRNKDKYLPKYVFSYYSGVSNRLQDHFNEHQRKFYNTIKSKNYKNFEIDSLRRLFYVQAVHSHFVLMAYYCFEAQESVSIQFLRDVLGIEELESILFVLRKPRWNNKEGDKRFFGAEGMVKDFLDKLWDLSVAPIYHDERIPVDFRSDITQQRLYLYIKDINSLKELAKHFNSNTEFFKALESTYISDLIEEVRVKVKKKFAGRVTFKELSEGEQQLLTVLGLLKFTKDEESLILLDEPDTHLNPIWKWRYLEFLDNVVQNEKNTQIIINTHDPLIIGGLTKEQVRIFQIDKDGGVCTVEPDIDPKGLGVEGILTGELFGLPTTLDEETQKDLDRRNELLLLQHKNGLNDIEQNELNALFNKLEDLGFSKTFRDPLYQKFIIAYTEKLSASSKKSYTKDELDAQNKMAMEILEDLKKAEDSQ